MTMFVSIGPGSEILLNNFLLSWFTICIKSEGVIHVYDYIHITYDYYIS